MTELGLDSLVIKTRLKDVLVGPWRGVVQSNDRLLYCHIEGDGILIHQFTEEIDDGCLSKCQTDRQDPYWFLASTFHLWFSKNAE